MSQKFMFGAVVSALVVSTSLFAAQAKKAPVVDSISGQGYGMAGCGLGSILFGSKPGAIQILAATFNGTAANQTFGITSGTSNCTEGAGVAAAELFIHANQVALQNDIARGNGETLASLGQIMGCDDASALGTDLKSNFTTIFPVKNTSPSQVSRSIVALVKTNDKLAASCGRI